MKRNQQLEREKQAQLLNEVKKQEDQKDETTEYFQVTTRTYSGGVVASWLVRLSSDRSFKPWPGTLCCVLGQDT